MAEQLHTLQQQLPEAYTDSFNAVMERDGPEAAAKMVALTEYYGMVINAVSYPNTSVLDSGAAR